MLLRIFIILALSHIALSQSNVTSLPGFPGDLPFNLETGYIGVGDLDEVQLFYYFIESESSPKDDPLLLWLTGGPGCSGLSGLLYEIGPFTFNYDNSTRGKPTLELNPYSWTKVANIIFLDSPVGTGFSYAKTWEAYNTSDSLVVEQAYSFLRKWLVNHPQFVDNPLYISGDSYSGMIVPIIVQEIYDGNDAGNKPQMNIKGYVLGNPLTDKYNDLNARVQYAHRVSLISDELYEATKSSCEGNYMDVDPDNSACVNLLKLVNECTEGINTGHIVEPKCSSLSPKPNLLEWDRSVLEENPENLIRTLPLLPEPWCRQYNYLYSYVWANDKTVQKALNIREGTITEWLRCNKSISYTYTYNYTNVVDFHRNLTNKPCRALVYSGDHEIVIPYIGTLEWIESLTLTIDTDWKPWFVEGQVAGFTEKLTNIKYWLTYTTIKGGGHTAPEYRPKQCLAMLSRWLAHFPL
ncbi:serine carboxypeptidase-like 18 isoform X1 [Cornus florida]|uniref:serine carboxypeptidase-like 18 isoform X1 n=1 Tax=Cornus florida TaxID=4283 RepID=UPI00289848CB|nr:serine carboxypeptidase-like 18 isoform X1 [Cornus florida]